MKRRSFLLGTGAAGIAAATGAGFWRWQEIASHVRYPGRDIGHRLRDLKPSEWPALRPNTRPTSPSSVPASRG